MHPAPGECDRNGARARASAAADTSIAGAHTEPGALAGSGSAHTYPKSESRPAGPQPADHLSVCEMTVQVP